MLKSFCIKTNNTNIINHIAYELDDRNIKEISVTCRNFRKYKNVIIHYIGENPEKLYTLVSEIITNIIIDFFEERLITNFLNSEYFYFSSDERKEILEYCKEMIKCSQKDDLLRRNYIFSACIDYIKENKSMVLEGFAHFRIKNYLHELDEIVDLSVDKYVLAKEYMEFVSLLRLYINSKDSKEDIVHLIYMCNESKLLNKNKQTIDISEDVFNAKYLSDISFSSNDYALNALLNLLPKKIYIHLIDERKDEFIETLELIFENRVNICDDCTICKLFRILQTENNKTTFKK